MTNMAGTFSRTIQILYCGQPPEVAGETEDLIYYA